MMLGERIRGLREDRFWTQKELADRTGFIQVYVHKVESGLVQSVGKKNLARFAQAFGMTLSELLQGVDEPPPREGLPTAGMPPFVARLIRRLEPALDEGDWRAVAAFLQGLAAGKPHPDSGDDVPEDGEHSNGNPGKNGAQTTGAQVVTEEREGYRT